MRIFVRLRARALSFLRNTSGNLTTILALSAVPLMLATGAGVDYARGMVVRSNMADALDAAALAVGKQTTKPASCSTASGSTSAQQTSCATLQAVAQKFFDANYKRDSASTGSSPTVVIVVANEAVTLSASDGVPNTFTAVGRSLMGASDPGMTITASSTVVWGQTKLWVALALDNTGSMCEPNSNPCSTDTSSSIKINALKTASKSLLTTLQNASSTPGDVMVAIAPFAKDVNVGIANVGASWIDWTDWNTAYPGSTPSSTVGPGDDCPFSSSYNDCLTQPGGVLKSSGAGTNVQMTTTSTIPSSGTYSGYICPGSISSSSSGKSGHYYNGCFNSVLTGTTQVDSGRNATCSGYNNCSCSGSGSNKKCNANTYSHTWITNAKSTWRGCVMDRDQSDDATNTTPGTLFPAENSDACPYAKVTTMANPAPTTTAAMTTMFTNLSTAIDTMLAGGGTNQTIGLAHAMQLLVSGAPYSAPTLPSGTTRYIILLSDGLNTLDRWYGNGYSQSSDVDTRMALACTNAKTQGFVIYTIFVDLGSSGNSDVLSDCATDTSKYYHLTTAGAIITTFDDIAQQITNLRVSQ